MFYGDIGYYVGIEDAGAGKQAVEKALIAGGYDFDRINPDGILRSRVEGKALVTPGGHRYSALVLPAIASPRAQTAEQIASFAASGLPVLFISAMPSRDTELLDYERRDARVQAAMTKVARSGGRVVEGAALVEALDTARVPANLRFTGDPSDIIFVERKVGSRLFYFLHNRAVVLRDASFIAPVPGGVESWDAMDGTVVFHDAVAVGGGTHVPLMLAPQAGVLLVVDPATRARTVKPPREIGWQELPASGWRLRAAGHVTGGVALERDLGEVSLGDWSAIPGLANFSGIGTYARTVALPREWNVRGVRVTLELGEVHDMATVTVNGRALPRVVSAPWVVDISAALKPGANTIEVAVANVPQNAVTDTKAAGFHSLRPVPVGLVGPVALKASR